MKIFRAKNNRFFLKVVNCSLIFIIAITLFSSSALVQACGGPNDPCVPVAGTPDPTAGTPDPSAGTPGVTINSGIKNPLGPGFTDLKSFIEGVLNFFLLIGIPIITLAIIYSGFLFVTAQGNSEKLKKAKQTLIYTLVGAALLLGCFVITHAIQGTVDQLKS